MHKALFIVYPTWISAFVLRSWLSAGNEIATVWCEAESPLLHPKKRLSGFLFPQFDTTRVLRNAAIKVRGCPPLIRWPDASKEALDTGADVLISVSTLQRIPQSLLDTFPQRAVNFHPALLPHYRGRAPFLGMLLDGQADKFGGITLHLLNERFDEGPIISQISCPRSAASDVFEWYFQIARAAGQLAAVELPAYLRGESGATPQDPLSGSYRKIKKYELDIGPHLTLNQVKERIKNFGKHHVHFWNNKNVNIPVTQLISVLSLAKGLPDRRRFFSIDVDLLDYRVRLRRRSIFFHITRIIARWKAMLRAAVYVEQPL